MLLTLAQIKEVNHETLVASGNVTYQLLLQELEQLCALKKSQDAAIAKTNEFHWLGEPIAIKTFADGRRLVYCVKAPYKADNKDISD
ncbi:hypothetical protein H0H87_006770 [Tephrocybe sp. NHM501043]|nr:hypothetical protein H0H87_006554 [Tephrocybe sp. NHM501043]KAG6826736.1 hypothetical protein H0H87_006553 [Tephrocybe sp. NHM501043]KAG6855208.1 hypothetical protein H0H87_006770 [Tephrocybe sp. NHM501043]